MYVTCVFTGQVLEEGECQSVSMSWQDRAAAAARVRRQKLFEDYHFICKCRLCAEEDADAGAGAGAGAGAAIATGTATVTGVDNEKPHCGDDAQEQDALAPIVALLYEQAVQPQTATLTRTAAERERDTERHRDNSRWRTYLREVGSQIQELRRIHPPNGAFLSRTAPRPRSFSFPPTHPPSIASSFTHSLTVSSLSFFYLR